jgi:hypothetical protein
MASAGALISGLFDMGPWAKELALAKAGLAAPPQPVHGKYYAVDVEIKQTGAAPNIVFRPRPDTSAPDDYLSLQLDIEHTLAVLKVLFFPKQKQRFDEYFARLTDAPLRRPC